MGLDTLAVLMGGQGFVSPNYFSQCHGSVFCRGNSRGCPAPVGRTCAVGGKGAHEGRPYGGVGCLCVRDLLGTHEGCPYGGVGCLCVRDLLGTHEGCPYGGVGCLCVRDLLDAPTSE